MQVRITMGVDVDTDAYREEYGTDDTDREIIDRLTEVVTDALTEHRGFGHTVRSATAVGDPIAERVGV
jgi:hypothetical protein